MTLGVHVKFGGVIKVLSLAFTAVAQTSTAVSEAVLLSFPICPVKVRLDLLSMRTDQ